MDVHWILNFSENGYKTIIILQISSFNLFFFLRWENYILYGFIYWVLEFEEVLIEPVEYV